MRAQHESQSSIVLQLFSELIECHHGQAPPYQTSGPLVYRNRRNQNGAASVVKCAGAAIRKSFGRSPPGIHPIERLSPTAPAVPYEIPPVEAADGYLSGITRTSSNPVGF